MDWLCERKGGGGFPCLLGQRGDQRTVHHGHVCGECGCERPWLHILEGLRRRQSVWKDEEGGGCGVGRWAIWRRSSEQQVSQEPCNTAKCPTQATPPPTGTSEVLWGRHLCRDTRPAPVVSIWVPFLVCHVDLHAPAPFPHLLSWSVLTGSGSMSFTDWLDESVAVVGSPEAAARGGPTRRGRANDPNSTSYRPSPSTSSTPHTPSESASWANVASDGQRRGAALGTASGSVADAVLPVRIQQELSLIWYVGTHAAHATHGGTQK